MMISSMKAKVLLRCGIFLFFILYLVAGDADFDEERFSQISTEEEARGGKSKKKDKEGKEKERNKYELREIKFLDEDETEQKRKETFYQIQSTQGNFPALSFLVNFVKNHQSSRHFLFLGGMLESFPLEGGGEEIEEEELLNGWKGIVSCYEEALKWIEKEEENNENENEIDDNKAIIMVRLANSLANLALQTNDQEETFPHSGENKKEYLEKSAGKLFENGYFLARENEQKRKEEGGGGGGGGFAAIAGNAFALSLMRGGRKGEARKVFEEALENVEEYSFERAMLLNNFGLLVREEGETEKAIEIWREAAYLPNGIDSAANLIGALLDLRQFEEAESEAKATIEDLEDRIAGGGGGGAQEKLLRTIKEMLAKALHAQEKFDEALEILVPSSSTSSSSSYLNSQTAAAVKISQKKYAEALLLGVESQEIWKLFADALRLEGTRGPLGSLAQLFACRAYKTIFRLAPNFSRPRLDYAIGFYLNGRYEMAANAYAQYLRRVHGNDIWGWAEKLVQLGTAAGKPTGRGRAKNIDEKEMWIPVEAHKDKKEGPGLDHFEYLVEGWHGLGAALEMTHENLSYSLLAYQAAYLVHPGYLTAFHSLVHMCVRACLWGDWDEMFQIAREKIDKNETVEAIGPIFALGYPLTTKQMCNVVGHRAQNLRNPETNSLSKLSTFSNFSIPLPPQLNFNDDSVPFRRVRIAVLSADFNIKPVGKLVQSLFRLMSANIFEVACYSLDFHDNSEVIQNLIEGLVLFDFVRGLPTAEIARRINSFGANVVVDLNGHTEGSRTAVAMYRPAPVHVNYLGFPYTLGIAEFDYLITDRIVTPPEQYLEGCFKEKLVVFPFTYMVNDYKQTYPLFANAPENNTLLAEHNIPTNVLRLANYNHLQKLDPKTFDLWMSILKENDKAIMWMLRFPDVAEDHLRIEAKKRSINSDRLFFSDRYAAELHLKIKRHADLFLDTLSYNAHVSGLDALWMGIPLLTMAGENMARRAGASFLTTLNTPELIARTHEEYAEIGKVLIKNAKKRTALRQKVMHERDEGPLFDTPAWVQLFERALCMMVDISIMNPDRITPLQFHNNVEDTMRMHIIVNKIQ